MATYRALLSLKSSLDDPDSRLSALSALRLLNLSNNVFNRTFPPELSNLTNLRVLDLYNNNLTGVLPVSVATFHSDENKEFRRLKFFILPKVDGKKSISPARFSSRPSSAVKPQETATLVPKASPSSLLHCWIGGASSGAAVRDKSSSKTPPIRIRCLLNFSFLRSPFGEFYIWIS
ncbi:hypothetical protein ACLB2K_035523 [Fragaria x ananassa]